MRLLEAHHTVSNRGGNPGNRGDNPIPVFMFGDIAADGKQFTVDDLIGMAAVPQAYREEVEAELKDLNALMQSVAALEQDTANPSSTTASALRPVRRR